MNRKIIYILPLAVIFILFKKNSMNADKLITGFNMKTRKGLLIGLSGIFLLLCNCSSDDLISFYSGPVKITLLVCDNDIAIRYKEDVSLAARCRFEKKNNLRFFRTYWLIEHYKIGGDSYKRSKELSKNSILEFATPVFYSELSKDYIYIDNQFGVYLKSIAYKDKLDSLNNSNNVSIKENRPESAWPTFFMLKIDRPDLHNTIELSNIYRMLYFISSCDPVIMGGVKKL